jgi:hypothetical protein
MRYVTTRGARDDMTLNNKKYHAKERFIITFRRNFSSLCSGNGKSELSRGLYRRLGKLESWRKRAREEEKCFMLANKSPASIFSEALYRNIAKVGELRICK